MTPQQVFNKCFNEERRIPKLEGIIISNSDFSYYYARDIIKGRWKRGEQSISSNPEWSYFYALDMIKGPWKRGEEAISKHPHYSYLYALNIIKGPFEKSHSIIFNSQFREHYISILKKINYDLNKISKWLI